MIPLYANYRTAIGGGGTTALVVPLDHAQVIPETKDRTPYQSIAAFLGGHYRVFQDRLAELRPHFDPADVPEHKIDDVLPYWVNNYFGRNDANVYYSLVRHLKPRRIIEIGSGVSTRFARKAITDGRLDCRLVCIDPMPRADIGAVADEIVSRSVVQLDPEWFQQLEPGDVLFNDGSHLVMHGSDVPYVVLRVMPLLKPGVLVHFHDIHLPLEYPAPCDPLYWGEQYLIGAMALSSRDWEVYLPVKYLYTRGDIGEGASFWLRRLPRAAEAAPAPADS